VYSPFFIFFHIGSLQLHYTHSSMQQTECSFFKDNPPPVFSQIQT